ncbi:MAG: EAL domain-containing protein [Alphaproteobacteria bacterium]|nr:EAL domain-containing protein [Alphaproteobacteria bacterium]
MLPLDLTRLARFLGACLLLLDDDTRVLAVAGVQEPLSLRPGGRLFESVEGRAGLAVLLGRLRRTGEPVLARLHMAGVGWEARLQMVDRREGRILVRLLRGERTAFTALNRQLRELQHQHRRLQRDHRTLAQIEAATRDLAERLAASEARYRSLVEQSPLLICRLGHDLLPSYVNRGFERFLSTWDGAEGGAEAPVVPLTLPAPLLDQLVPVAIDVLSDGRPRDVSGIELAEPTGSIWVDFRVVPELDQAGPATSVLCIGTDVTQRVDSERRLAAMAMTDGLTGLPNRMLFVDRLAVALKRLGRGGSGVAVLFLDLDGFKLINDSAGHEAGDLVLRVVAGRLQGTVRDQDSVARMGGDEFVVLAEDIPRAEVPDLCRRIREALVEPVDERWSVHASVGFAWTDTHRPGPDLIRDADAAMYEAKRRGRDQAVEFTRELRTTARERLRVEGELLETLHRSSFALHFQPIVDVAAEALVGAEALIRWPHRGQILPPDSFLGIAAESTLIGAIGTWVLQSAIRHLMRWREDGSVDERFVLHVNVAAIQLADPRFTDELVELLAGMGRAREQICLEITEQMLLSDHGRVIPSAIDRLGEMGVKMALDDFGTGSSSLVHLRRYPIGAVKVDRSFVERLPDSTDDRAIVEAVMAMSRTLSLAVVAEGVESHAQSALLRRAGCTLQQGFLFGRPVGADDFLAAHGLSAGSRAGGRDGATTA